MDLKDYAPKRKTIAIYALMLAVACVGSVPLLFFGPTMVIPLTILFWIGFLAYPIQKTLLLAIVWVALLTTMYVFAARIAAEHEWKTEIFKCFLAIAVICVVANLAVGTFNATYGTSCDKEADCIIISCNNAVSKNYIYLEPVGQGSMCQTIWQPKCIEHKCQIPKT